MYTVKKLGHRLVLFLGSHSTGMISKMYTESTAVVLTFFLCLLNKYILCIEFSPASWTMSSPYTYWEIGNPTIGTQRKGICMYITLKPLQLDLWRRLNSLTVNAKVNCLY